jgi:glycosyltransferase involved in cell wall biosynthesis
MRLAYVCADQGIPVLGFKGASVHVRSITSALQARGHDVHVFCAALGAGNAPPAVASLAPVAELPGAMASLAFDAVIERYALLSGPTGDLCAAHGVRLLLEVNAPLVFEAAAHRGLDDVESWLAHERTVFAGADVLMPVSTELARYVGSVPTGARVEVVPNGVDVDAFSAPPAAAPSIRGDEGAVTVGFAGSMKPWHGVDDLIDACRPLPARLRLAGTGPCLDALRARAGDDERVEFAGAVPHAQVPAFLAGVDIAVAPYRPSEGFYFSPLKVLEYLAAGLPVVYPSMGDLPGVVGEGGIAYRPGDVGAMSAAIECLVGDRGLRARLGRAARARAEQFSWDAVAARIEALL